MNNHSTRRTFICQTAAGGLALAAGQSSGILPTMLAAVPKSPSPPALERGVRQLFLDDLLVEQMDGLRSTVNQPAKYEKNPIIRHDQTPWQQFRAQLYGTALYDAQEKLFKIWYLAGVRLPGDEPITINGRLCCPNFQCVGYATSKDGFHFELPNLGLVNLNGSTENNLCRISRECAEGIAVVKTPHDPDPQRRYKALYWEHFVPYKGSPGVSVNGMSVSFSADGKDWTNHKRNPVMGYGSDTGQQALWDPKLKKYVAYGRFGAGGRRVARSESNDFIHWSTPKLVFKADAADGPGNTQIYGMGISIYEGVYLGLPWMFREGTTWNINTQLATSRDGSNWSRVGDRQTFIPNGPEGSWDEGIIFTASQPAVVVGNTIYIYYSASQHNHDYRENRKRLKNLVKGTPQWDQFWNPIKTSIGVATLRRDGFVSLDTDQKPGTLLTKPFLWPEGGKLHVNAQANQGEVRVAVRDEQAKPIAGLSRSTSLRGDQHDHTIVWPDNRSAPASGRPVRLQFTLHHAKLYSYWIA